VVVTRPEPGRLGLELRCEEVADCKAAIGPPTLGELQHLELGRHPTNHLLTHGVDYVHAVVEAGLRSAAFKRSVGRTSSD
jgi:hypothetical protein